MSKADKYLASLIKEYPEEYASKSYVAEEEAGGDWEDKYTIGGHTKRVIGQFNKYKTFDGEPLPKTINKDLFKNILALHDIGVHRAVTEKARDEYDFASAKKRHQHEYTSKYLHDVLKKKGYSDKDISVAESIVSGDPLGSYLKGESSASDTAKKIRASASKAGIPTKDFFSALNAYYMSDASSYTRDGGGIESLDYLFNPNGKDLAYSEYTGKQVNKLKGQLLGGKEKSGAWATKYDKYYSPEALEAIQGTEDASLTDKGLKLNVVRYQSPEIAGEQAIRTGVFFLPEKKSPYQKYYTTGRTGYGGKMRTEGQTTYRHPIVIKGASGGKVPERAYDLLNGKGAYAKMRMDVLDNTGTYNPYGRTTQSERIDKIESVLKKYGGNPNMAYDIMEASKQGNTLAYALQEHIVANSVRKAGYDSVIGYSKVGGKTRLSEVFDVRQSYYPDEEKWEEHYEDFYKGKKVPEKLEGTWAKEYKYDVAGTRDTFEISLPEGAYIQGYLKNADFHGEKLDPLRGELFYEEVPEKSRKKGLGKELAVDALNLMREKGIQRVNMSTTSSEGKSLVASLIKAGEISPIRVSPISSIGKTEYMINKKGTWAAKYAPMPLQRFARPHKKVKGHSSIKVGRVK